MKQKSKLDWKTSTIPIAGRIAVISDEGCCYWAEIPNGTTLKDATCEFKSGYDYGDFKGKIPCLAVLIVNGLDVETIGFTLEAE